MPIIIPDDGITPITTLRNLEATTTSKVKRFDVTEENAYLELTRLNLLNWVHEGSLALNRELKWKKQELENRAFALQFDRFLKEMKEKWTLQNLTLDLKFNLPLDLNDQWFYGFQKMPFWAIWEKPKKTETDSCSETLSLTKWNSTTKQMTNQDALNKFTTNVPAMKFPHSYNRMLVRYNYVLPTINNDIRDIRETFAARHNRLWNGRHLIRMQNFDTLIRFFGHSSFPINTKLYKTLDDYQPVIENNEYEIYKPH